ncbi:hypothetical protein CYMTET_55939, partial [Cymbomonas tetramitiformis]
PVPSGSGPLATEFEDTCQVDHKMLTILYARQAAVRSKIAVFGLQYYCTSGGSVDSKTPTDSGTSTSSSEGETRMHSTDIAFKPASSGWGYSKEYAKGYDRIFGKKTRGARPQPEAVKQPLVADTSLSSTDAASASPAGNEGAPRSIRLSSPDGTTWVVVVDNDGSLQVRKDL